MRQASQTIALVVVLLCAGSVFANTELLKTHAGSLVHWKHAEITVGLASSDRSKSVGSEGVAQAIRHATQAWNVIHAGQPRLQFITLPNAAVTIIFCRGQWRGNPVELGNTQFTASLRDGTVEAATVELNECDHSFAGPGEAVRASYDLQAVVTHELGHVLGLGHSDNPSAVMFPSTSGVGVRTPHAEDKTTLAIIYFGRAPTLIVPESGREGTPPGSHAISPRSDKEMTWRAGIRAMSGPSTDAADVAVPAADPVNPVPVLSLTTNGGRQMFVYTCEPTMLPPLSAAPTSRDIRRPPGHRAGSGPQ